MTIELRVRQQRVIAHLTRANRGHRLRALGCNRRITSIADVGWWCLVKNGSEQEG